MFYTLTDHFCCMAFRKGYINASDLKCVFLLLGETVSDEEIQSKSSFFCVPSPLTVPSLSAHWVWRSYPTDVNLPMCLFLVAMIKIAGTKSNDKINFKEFVDFFYKVDWGSSKINETSTATTWPTLKTERAWYFAANVDNQIHIIYTNWVAAFSHWRGKVFNTLVGQRIYYL